MLARNSRRIINRHPVLSCYQCTPRDPSSASRFIPTGFLGSNTRNRLCISQSFELPLAFDNTSGTVETSGTAGRNRPQRSIQPIRYVLDGRTAGRLTVSPRSGPKFGMPVAVKAKRLLAGAPHKFPPVRISAFRV